MCEHESSPSLSVCPLCGGAVEAGKAAVSQSMFAFFLVGFSYRELTFQPEASSRPETVLCPLSGEVVAFRCVSCATVVVPGTQHAIAVMRSGEAG